MTEYSGHEPRFTVVSVEGGMQRWVVLVRIYGGAILYPERINAGGLPSHLRGVTTALHHRDEKLL
jgi:hypothetical protein